MIKAILSDFSRVLLFPKDESYGGSLNGLYRQEKGSHDFRFFDFFYLNEDLLNYYKSLRSKVKIYMLTSEQIQNDPALQPYLAPVFDEIFSAEDMGVHKKQAEAYQLVAQEAGLQPEEILFIDDSKVNLDAASEAGCMTLQFLDNDHTKPDIQEVLG